MSEGIIAGYVSLFILFLVIGIMEQPDGKGPTNWKVFIPAGVWLLPGMFKIFIAVAFS